MSLTTGHIMCGRPSKKVSSTRFGSIITRRNSLGVLRMMSDMMIEVSEMLLPLLVDPPISKCGIRVKSVYWLTPLTSLPRATMSRDLLSWNSRLSHSSRKVTMTRASFGTSTPMAALPGMGASTRTCPAFMFIAMLSARAVIRLTRIPGPSWIS